MHNICRRLHACVGYPGAQALRLTPILLTHSSKADVEPDYNYNKETGLPSNVLAQEDNEAKSLDVLT